MPTMLAVAHFRRNILRLCVTGRVSGIHVTSSVVPAATAAASAAAAVASLEVVFHLAAICLVN